MRPRRFSLSKGGEFVVGGQLAFRSSTSSIKARPGFAPGCAALRTAAYLLGHRAVFAYEMCSQFWSRPLHNECPVRGGAWLRGGRRSPAPCERAGKIWGSLNAVEAVQQRPRGYIRLARMEVEWQTAGLPVLKSGFESRHPLRRPAWARLLARS